jgi:hypothetical protein
LVSKAPTARREISSDVSARLVPRCSRVAMVNPAQSATSSNAASAMVRVTVHSERTRLDRRRTGAHFGNGYDRSVG